MILFRFSNRNKSVLLYSLIYILMLFGCASTGKIEEMRVNKSIKALKSEYKTVAVEFVYIDDNKADSTIPDQLIGAIVDNLREKNIFNKVYSKSATLIKNFDLVVEVSPLDINDADLAQSIIAWAGRSELKTKVRLTDGKTGVILGHSVVIGKAAFKATIFTSSSMAQAIERAGEKIADYVANSI